MPQAINFKQNIPAFLKLLNNVQIEHVSTEPYCKEYLGYILKHKIYFLEIYSDVLEKVANHSVKNPGEIVLVDFGAGNGMLGIYAKFCGVKKVFINDIDTKFVAAAEQLSKQVRINIDGFIRGDIEAVKVFFNGETPDAIAGTDVIEHIYSLQEFFHGLRKINPSIISVFTTASNPKNHFKMRRLKDLQLKDEYEGGKPGDCILFGETALEPYLKTREQIILRAFDLIDDKALTTLTRLTRGMNQEDILSAVNKYKESGIMPAGPAHPTNTCNPVSGSWTERILTLDEYVLIYHSNGFTVKFYKGFYDEYKKGLKSAVNTLLNICVRIFGFGIYFAPYIVLVGSKK